jgi:hypothetical protein
MPLNFGKIGAAIALITVAAFVLWLIATTFFATEQADQEMNRPEPSRSTAAPWARLAGGAMEARPAWSFASLAGPA